jgi:hypothetical protein
MKAISALRTATRFLVRNATLRVLVLLAPILFSA